MTLLLNILLLIPLAGFLISLFIPKKNENLISGMAVCVVSVHLVCALIFIALWLAGSHPTMDVKDIELIRTADYEFFIDLYFDKITAVYLLIGAFQTFLVMIYSKYYMHRETGYKRFFNTTLLLYLGYNVVVLSGNMETLFIGWEILGISSFLLIAFYRDRYLPVKNAVKVFTIYRIGDIGLLLAMWLSHHLWHANITFEKLNHYVLVHEQLSTHSLVGIFISLMILISAAAKSAQLPFSSWLPRAMEGPTPSSAIFYGSLSVHMGVFILLRTHPFWEHQLSIRILIGVLGLSTAIVASGIARVQSSVKSQIAYASIAQIGLMFIEIAAGFDKLVLIHFAGNAFLRTYQLLVSPSVVSYLIREQFYHFTPHRKTYEDFLPKKLAYTLYSLCLKEWNLDSFMYRYMWNPVKWAGRKLNFLNVKRAMFFFIPVYLTGLIILHGGFYLSPQLRYWLPLLFSLIGVIMVLKAFAERQNVFMSLMLIIMNHFWVALAIAYNEQFKYIQVYIYLSGIVLAGAIAYLCLKSLKKLEHDVDLTQFHGYAYKHPIYGFVFLLCCLALTGFPITPTFVGEDLIFTHIATNQPVLAFFTALSFVVDGIATIRIYARVFLGPHVKSVYEMAYRSS